MRMFAPAPTIGGPVPPIPIIKPPPVQPPVPTGSPIAGQRIYVTTQGDWWDMIAFRVYGAQRGTEHLMYRLIEANYPLRTLAMFPAGVAVIIPTIDVASTEVPLVPWKNATVVPTP